MILARLRQKLTLNSAIFAALNHPLSLLFMNLITTPIPDLLIFEPKIFGDARGFFLESFNQKTFQNLTGLDINFVQDNHSRSSKNVLRGLHYQIQNPQGKLVRVVSGSVFDVAVDLRKSSPTFGKWHGVELTAENHRQFWIPAGFAHGFVVLSETADFLYKTTEYYAPQFERCLRWNDETVGIDWTISNPLLSAKDEQGLSLQDAEVFA
jgi:dTDP-4-dehydrorhamnose 3,5-epimerase